jgi:hypothetical protein
LSNVQFAWPEKKPEDRITQLGKGFALDIPLWLRFGLWLGARKNLGPWVLLWQAALKDT